MEKKKKNKKKKKKKKKPSSLFFFIIILFYFFPCPCLTWTGFWVKKGEMGKQDTKEKHQEKKRFETSARRVSKLSSATTSEVRTRHPSAPALPQAGKSCISQVVHRCGQSVPWSCPASHPAGRSERGLAEF